MIDIDGTLLDKNGIISAADRQALAMARKAGIEVSLCTGRAARACSNIMNELALDGFHIFFDGALVCNRNQDEEIYAQPISQAVVRQAIDFALRHGIPLELYSATHYFVEWDDWRSDIHREFFSLMPTVMDFTDLWRQERIIKGGIVASSQEEATKVRDFSREFNGRLNFSWARTPAYPGLDFINIITQGVSKGKALEALVSRLGITTAEVMAIGDGVNDISLLSAAGKAVAMQNAPDEVKAVADHITGDVEHSGVAAAIYKFLL